MITPLSLAVPEPHDPDTIIFSVDGVEVGRITDFGPTGSFYDFIEIEMPGMLALSQGMHMIRATAGTSVFNIDYLQLRAVPEPASWGMLVLGLLGLLAAGRRRPRTFGTTR